MNHLKTAKHYNAKLLYNKKNSNTQLKCFLTVLIVQYVFEHTEHSVLKACCSAG